VRSTIFDIQRFSAISTREIANYILDFGGSNRCSGGLIFSA